MAKTKKSAETLCGCPTPNFRPACRVVHAGRCTESATCTRCGTTITREVPVIDLQATAASDISTR